MRKFGVGFGRCSFRAFQMWTRQWRRLICQSAFEGGDVGGTAFDMDHDLPRLVADPAGEIMCARDAIDEGTEAHALHAARNDQPARGECRAVNILLGPVHRCL